MTRASVIGVIVVCMMIAASACGGGAGSSIDPTPARFTASLDSDTSIGCDGSRLELSSIGSDGLKLRLKARRLAGAKAIYGRVHYDPALYHFTECTADGSDNERIWLAMDCPERGYVEFGWALTDLHHRRGMRGEMQLCELRFAPGAVEVKRQVRTAPHGPSNVFQLVGSVDVDNIPTLTWDDTHAGDGNNDSLVNISDITSIAVQWNELRDVSSQTRKADYNLDGMVNISDITTIAQNWNGMLAGYAVFSGPTEGNLSEVVRLDRGAQFTNPQTTDGVLEWDWTGAAITEDTYFQVQPYDAAGALGDASENIVMLEFINPVPTITDINSINVPPTYTVDGDGNYIILISELSVDEIVDNTEPFAPESIQLTAQVTTDLDPAPVEATEGLIWYISEGSGLAEINEPVDPADTGSLGLLTFINRGKVTITAQVPGDFNKTASASFVLMGIDSVALTSGGGVGPIAANAGDTVPFVVMGTFDDGIDNGNEVEQNITGYSNWGALSNPPGATFSLDTFAGSLDTTGAGGADIQVTCEYPRTEDVTIGDNTRKASNMVTVNVS